jgi:hypothetical protein
MMKKRTSEIRSDIGIGRDVLAKGKWLLAQINPESSNRNAKTPITRTAVAVAIEREGSSR